MLLADQGRGCPHTQWATSLKGGSAAETGLCAAIVLSDHGGPGLHEAAAQNQSFSHSKPENVAQWSGSPEPLPGGLDERLHSRAGVQEQLAPISTWNLGFREPVCSPKGRAAPQDWSHLNIWGS